MNAPDPDRLARALLSLDGLSVADAFGQHVFRAPEPPTLVLRRRIVPPAPWRWSDDTAMAIALVEATGAIPRDWLAAREAIS